ncbi:DNA end-binding protein Ku [Streptacidiphilus sp. MAP12-20]|uniref:non-homologous end joining protein Ku n=1 Tax=Streptacidiphilus sp. MAP12-20 TaxID=3156299 RepID=UPI003511D991
MGEPIAIKPSWTGSITFGLVAVPVKLYPATESHSGPEMHQYHRADSGRVRNKRYCIAEDREVEYGELAKGWEASDGRMVVLTDEDLEQLPLPSKNVIDVHAFVDETSINTLSWDSPYFVGLGDKAPAKPYKLLAAAMRGSGKVAVTKVALRGRESLAILRERDGLLILQTVKWPDEIRSAEGIKGAPADEELHPAELKMARQFMDSKSEGYDLDAEKDAYVVALEDALRARANDLEPAHETVTTGAAKAPVLDLMAALQASIAETQAGRDAAPAKKTTAKKRAPRKAS